MAIVITELGGSDLSWFKAVIESAQENGQSIKVSQHSGTGQIMVKRGGGTWSPLFGKDVTERPTPTEYLAMEDEGLESERRARAARGQEGWV